MPEAKQATKREVLTDSRQPSSSAVRFHAGALSDVQVEQPGGRTDRYGQFVFAVDGARNDPDELFDRAHAAEQIGDIAAAERLYRLLIKSDPTDASAPFNLRNMLRAAARTVEAEAALLQECPLDCDGELFSPMW